MKVFRSNCQGITRKMVQFSLTFVRHGETMYNRKNIIQGQTDIPLSSLGERQAELVGSRLQSERVTHVFSSDLSRAHQTAKIITDANKVCKSDIILDKRLRERKFGTAEGKTRKELLLAAKKAKRRFSDHTPQGAETVGQVQERVQLFFKDVCKMCMQLSEEADAPYTPARIKRRHGGSLGRNSRHSKRLQISGRSQSFCGSGNIQNIINQVNMVSDYDTDSNDIDLNDMGFCHDGSYISMQDGRHCESGGKVIEEFPTYREYFPSGSDDSNMSGDLRTQGSCKLTRSMSHNSEMGSDVSPSSLEQNSSESDSTLSDSINIIVPYSESCEIQTGLFVQPKPSYLFPSPGNVSNIDSNTNSPYYGCPNVSLSLSSPGQPFSSISSISSGRNSSFDDLDELPLTVADILVVSHGGFIKECMRFFAENLDCKIPGVKGHALKVCPNGSISKFTITLEECAEKPSVTCITIHDKDHLIGLEVPDAKGEY